MRESQHCHAAKLKHTVQWRHLVNQHMSSTYLLEASLSSLGSWGRVMAWRSTTQKYVSAADQTWFKQAKDFFAAHTTSLLFMHKTDQKDESAIECCDDAFEPS